MEARGVRENQKKTQGNNSQHCVGTLCGVGALTVSCKSTAWWLLGRALVERIGAASCQNTPAWRKKYCGLGHTKTQAGLKPGSQGGCKVWCVYVRVCGVQ